MTDLRVIDGEATDAAVGNGHKPDEFEQLRDARKRPMGATDDDGKALRGLSVANKLANLNTKTRIVGVIRRGSDGDPQYSVQLANGASVEGTEGQVFDPRIMERRFHRASGRPVLWHAPKDWKVAADAIVKAAKDDLVSGGEVDDTRELLGAFAEHCGVRAREDAKRHAEKHDPAILAASDPRVLAEDPQALARAWHAWSEDYSDAVDLDDMEQRYEAFVSDVGVFRATDGRLYVRVPKLRQWAADNKLPRLTSSEVRRRLAALGFTKPGNPDGEGKITAWDATRKQSVTRQYLASPAGFEV